MRNLFSVVKISLYPYENAGLFVSFFLKVLNFIIENVMTIFPREIMETYGKMCGSEIMDFHKFP